MRNTYNFIAAIEAAIDLASHLISKRQLRAPEDYADTFQVLAEADILTDTFGGELKKMAGFRNRLVHRYWDVDASELPPCISHYRRGTVECAHAIEA